MPRFYVRLRALAYVRAVMPVDVATQEQANAQGLEEAKEGNALWRYDGLTDDASIELDD